MRDRVELHNILVSILGSGNVYFQPPENLKLNHPCIVYELSKINKRFANDQPYTVGKSYQVSYITKDPDDVIVDLVAGLRYCSFSRSFVSDNFHHYIFDIYF